MLVGELLQLADVRLERRVVHQHVELAEFLAPGRRPQRDWLSLVNTGDGRALLARRGVSLQGRPVWWLKDRIDRRFVRRFQRLERDAV